ncbi:hypothetical protein GCM10027169_12800 [Gordonia jinhuaensis]|uniref:Uncharacterized protein n=1 Tax=Gordonia jinhuaensis TaxID=1517702 RepID=A0A916WR87_9ACTN|nr:hypothetical protein [Gordonia jinhuaensis]GGB22340.1 hypothetical protein GCM10011489_08140 [Gordonia jinhuaensis]
MTAMIGDTNETVGKLWGDLAETMGTRACLRIWEYQDIVEIVVDQLDPERFPTFGNDLDPAHIDICKRDIRFNTLTVRARTRVQALRLAFAALAFPPSTGASLRLVKEASCRS